MDEGRKTGRNRRPQDRAWVVCLLLLVCMAVVPGCINLLKSPAVQENVTRDTLTPQPTMRQDPAGVSPIQPEIPTGMSEEMYYRLIASGGLVTVSPSQTPVEASRTPLPPDLVTDAMPVITPDPYPAQHAVRINANPLMAGHYTRAADFKKTYVLRANSTGLVVNATTLKGPLWIGFTVKPLYDCVNDPDSCRGSGNKIINRPYFTLTVRDNQTRAIVAEDGYGREFGSRNYTVPLKIYGEGRYHLTLSGDSVDVTLVISTDDTRPIPANQIADAPSLNLPSNLPEAVRERIRRGGTL